jgi:membrane dipeptidase
MRLRVGTYAALLVLFVGNSLADDGPAVSKRARQVHDSGLLLDGHNDLPWRIRDELKDLSLEQTDLAPRRSDGHTDIPRLRAGGLKAQFWSVYIPARQPNPSRTVTEQIDLVYRLVERYPDVFAMAYTADDVDQAAEQGKIASLIGIEGGVAIENDLAVLRGFYRQGARYMTLTHSDNLDWADSATDEEKHGGLTPFGERVVREMNRLGMLVDLSHVSHKTMHHALRVAKAPVIFSHSSAYAIAPHPRNVPDDVLAKLKDNGGVVMVNFFSGFISPEYARQASAARKALRAKFADETEFRKALDVWYETEAPKLFRGDVKTVADHIDHIVKIAGIDHVGIGSDFDGIKSTPEGLEDVSCYPRLTEELLKRGYDEAMIHKILGRNVLRVMRAAEQAAQKLQAEQPADAKSFDP